MTTRMNKYGNQEIRFLSREDLEVLIYMTSDVWITPEVKRFKDTILDKV